MVILATGTTRTPEMFAGPIYSAGHANLNVTDLTGVDILVATPYRLFCELTKRGCIEKFTITKETPHHGKLKPV